MNDLFNLKEIVHLTRKKSLDLCKVLNSLPVTDNSPFGDTSIAHNYADHHFKASTPENEGSSFYSRVPGPCTVGVRSSSLSSGRGSSEGVGSRSGSGSGGAASRSSSSGHGGAGFPLPVTSVPANGRSSAPGPNSMTVTSGSHSSSGSNCSTGSLTGGMELNNTMLATTQRTGPNSVLVNGHSTGNHFHGGVTQRVTASAAPTECNVLPTYSGSSSSYQPTSFQSMAAHTPPAYTLRQIPPAHSVGYPYTSTAPTSESVRCVSGHNTLIHSTRSGTAHLPVFSLADCLMTPKRCFVMSVMRVLRMKTRGVLIDPEPTAVCTQTG
ncbi:hypothetical protein X801_03800 [Opisthorchis viverrini]|uniref:Uncharacterized protein n=1 Tax=Opisthorchis viverrini TaxID=6198 RepID=A0A1S8X0U2_OPIVI|nr:hypothetical protein X801_03800 [Opisthorchis viverrini]